jgi:hypothetical protein
VQTFTVPGVVTHQGTLRIETPVDLPPGLGAETWGGVDVKEYLRELREDRENRPSDACRSR